ncbi:ECF RNA polymerase sigma factor SigM [Paenibacillus solanacearum]|uniref:ECF RNA polymerase sigma factor SigM n=1 Tax=Paenibacillus solanacearum TaxID=2048548 RepID=A0A916K408_9BACL|nr:sigma-70 family RNA polymerase sigma factor [Paenibacillus solanacearum]CAG7641849.1 ECF RNA polymerase sigma factor SigM [Paenibacillus solanacearum]
MESVQAAKEIYRHPQDKLHADVLSAAQFSEIYELYFDRVYKYICYRIQNQHEAEDLCSQVFERVILHYHKFSAEKAKFDVWLFAIVRNAVTDYYRARPKRFHFSLDAIAEFIFPKPSPEELAIQDDTNQALLQAVAKLRDKERHIIALKFGARLKNAEIAELMGISESHLGVVVHRSLKKLQNLLLKARFMDE